MSMTDMPMNMNMDMNNYMHVSFYWGKNVTILFQNWPGHSLQMYILALLLVFVTAATVELLSVPAADGGVNRVSTRAVYSHTCVYAVRVGLSYVVMLSVMSFNVGVFMSAVAGHAVGFFAAKFSAHRRSKLEQDEEDPSFVP